MTPVWPIWLNRRLIFAARVSQDKDGRGVPGSLVGDGRGMMLKRFGLPARIWPISGRAGLFSVLMVAGLMVAPVVMDGAANAQSNNDVANRISRLESEIRDLQRHLFAGKSSPASVVSSTAVQETSLKQSPEDAAAASSMAARAEIRLQQLEAQMRNLTGKVEELDFKMIQAIRRMDTLVADLDRRFDALEGRGPAAGATAGQSISGGVAATATTDNTGTAGGSDGKKPGVLGYLNESDLRDIESGRREDQATTGVADTQQSSIPQATAAPPTTQAATGPVLPEGDAASRYKHAFSYLMRHDYDTAEIAFREFVDGHGDDPLAGNAMYWLGETYYVREMFAESAVTFAEGYERYPGSPKTADNLLKLSFSLARLNRVEDACVALAQLSDEFPNASSTIKRRALTEGRRIGCKG